MSIQSEIERISNNVQATLSTIAETGVEVGENSDALPAAAAALANEKVSVNQGTNHAGKLLYVNASGAVTPLTLGDGLTIADGVIQAAGGGGGDFDVLTIEEIRAICAPPSDFEMNYTQVEYIQSTGTQYIDTGVKGKTGVMTEIDFSAVDVSLGVVLGSYSSAGRFYPLVVENGTFRFGYGAMQTAGGTVTAGQKYVVKSSLLSGKQTFTVNGTELYAGSNTTTYNTGLSLFLFANHYTATQAIDHAKIKLYSCQIYDNGTLVRDYVPCYRNSDKAVGLYDKVGAQFYTNAGSGSFTGA